MTPRDELEHLVWQANGAGEEADEALACLRMAGADAVEVVIEALRKEPQLRPSLAGLVAALAEAEHVPLLRRALAEDNYQLQEAAAAALGAISGQDALASLTNFLLDESNGIIERGLVASALGRTGQPEAIPALLSFGAAADGIRDENIESGGTREIAVTAVAIALARLGRHDFGPQVVELLAHPFPPARARAARALHETVAPGMLAALRAVVMDEDAETGRNAVHAIYLLGAKQCVDALVPVLDKFGSDQREIAGFCLFSLTDGYPAEDEASEEYGAWWRDERSKAADDTVLWKLNPRAVGDLVQLLHDPSGRRMAAWELDLMGTGISHPGSADPGSWNAVASSAESWLVQYGHLFKPGRLYKHGFQVDLSPLLT